MPILPLEYPEPHAAVLGTMLYPGVDEAERRKARAFAAQYLAEPLRIFDELGGSLPAEQWKRIAMDSGVPLDDLQKRWRWGAAAGDIFNVLFFLENYHPDLASWNHAVQVVEVSYSRAKPSGSRSNLWSAKKRFESVIHLWGAWNLRDRKFRALPEVGYDWFNDFHAFLTESEILRQQDFRNMHFLPEDAWRLPDDWEPIERQPGWPKTGVIAKYFIDTKLLEGLKAVGRPKTRT